MLFGSAIGGIIGIVEQHNTLLERGPDRVSPYFIPSVLPDSASGQIALELGVRGPNYAPVSACATGSTAIGEAAEVIRRGDADVILAGGAEAAVTPLILAGFCAMRGLAAEGRIPAACLPAVRRDACRVRDRRRRVRARARGAGAARARGAHVYAEVLAYGASNDAYHLAAPDPEAVGVAEMMRAALRRAGLEPESVGYINAHGTSTPLGDAAETLAIKEVFGEHAYKLAVSSTKSVHGHCFGAAGAVEAMMCVLALQEGILPPTINYEVPTPSATSTTFRTRLATSRSTWRSRTRWAWAATTAASSSGGLRSLHSRRRKVGERIQHDIGVCERLVVRGVGRVGDGQHPHPGRFGRADSGMVSSTAAACAGSTSRRRHASR